MSYELGKKRIIIEPTIKVDVDTLHRIKQSAREGKGFIILETKADYIRDEDKAILTMKLELEW